MEPVWPVYNSPLGQIVNAVLKYGKKDTKANLLLLFSPKRFFNLSKCVSI
jgi:hypothetical protein